MNAMKNACCWMLVIAGMLIGTKASSAGEIVWSGNLYQSAQQAMKAKQPLIVFFNCDCQSECWARRVEKDIFQPGTLNAFASQAQFVDAKKQDEDTHGNYKRLKDDLKIEKFPTLVVLDVRTDEIQECGRIVGYFKPEIYLEKVKSLVEAWEARHAELMTQVETRDQLVLTGWTMYYNRSLDFQVAFPNGTISFQGNRTSNEYTYRSTVPGGTQEMAIFVREAPTYVIEDLGAASWLKLHAKVFAEEVGGDVAEMTVLEQDGSTKCQFQIVNDEGTKIGQGQVVLHGKRLYSLMAKSDGKESTNLAGSFFLGSFQPNPNRVTSVVAGSPVH